LTETVGYKTKHVSVNLNSVSLCVAVYNCWRWTSVGLD